ncbi:MAG: NifB/NifX family molybdenum-iron cluster-binding protein [Thermoplasmata archaeon]
MKIVIPVEENRGKESIVCEHFGRAPYFAVYDREKEKLEIVENRSEHFGGTGTPAENILRLKPDIVFVANLGTKAIELMRRHNVKIKTGNFRSVDEVIRNIDKLEDLESACKDGMH